LSINHLYGLLLLFVNLLLQIVRWWWLLRIQRLHFTFWEAIKLSWVGHFFSLALPGTAGGELARAYYVSRGAPKAKFAGISTVLLDRFLGLNAILWLGSLSILFFAFHNELNSTVIQIGGLVILLTMSSSVLFLLFWFRYTRYLMLMFVPVRFQEFLTVVLNSYLSQGKDLLTCFALSILASLLLIGAFLMAVQITGASISLLSLLLIGPLVIVANSLPITPGGIGVAETTASLLFAQFGVGKGATIMLIVRLGFLLLRLPGGLIFMMGAKTRTIR
jgi:uncharacterized protein (TIRG00374 family)